MQKYLYIRIIYNMQLFAMQLNITTMNI